MQSLENKNTDDNIENRIQRETTSTFNQTISAGKEVQTTNERIYTASVIQKDVLNKINKEFYFSKIAPSELIVFDGYTSFDIFHWLLAHHMAAFIWVIDGHKGLNEELGKNVTAASKLISLDCGQRKYPLSY